MIRNNLRHQKGHFVRRVELSGLLPGIGGKLADQVLVDKPEDIVILLTV